jgi:catechol 2,3-dioxygenase-like lactoylglutathione lyase family enzyme
MEFLRVLASPCQVGTSILLCKDSQFMAQFIANVTLVVRDYDEAIAYFTRQLGFALVEDTRLSDTKRWVRVGLPGGKGTSLLLAKAANPEQSDRAGNQTGGRVAFFLHTDNFTGDYERMRSCGVRFLEMPRHEAYGTVAVFEDLYGNRWDLIQPKQPDTTS